MKETTNEKNAHKNLTYSKRHKEEYMNMGQGGAAWGKKSMPIS